MNDEVGKFCVHVHEKLESLQARLTSLKANIGTTWHYLQEKLYDVRRRSVMNQQAIELARVRLEQWGRRTTDEARAMSDGWLEGQDRTRLVERAEQAEQIATLAILLAEAGIDDVERMVLEAVAARRAAESVTLVGAASRR